MGTIMITKIREDEVIMIPESDRERLIIEMMLNKECRIKTIEHDRIRIEVLNCDKNQDHA